MACLKFFFFTFIAQGVLRRILGASHILEERIEHSNSRTCRDQLGLRNNKSEGLENMGEHYSSFTSVFLCFSSVLSHYAHASYIWQEIRLLSALSLIFRARARGQALSLSSIFKESQESTVTGMDYVMSLPPVQFKYRKVDAVMKEYEIVLPKGEI